VLKRGLQRTQREGICGSSWLTNGQEWLKAEAMRSPPHHRIEKSDEARLEGLMTQTRRTVLCISALAAAIAVFVGEATRATWAQAIPQISARVVAVNIPGASAIAQVGTFLSGLPTTPPPAYISNGCKLPHPIPTNFANFIVPGAVLDQNRILVGSPSNFGAPLALEVGQQGSFLSIDPSGPSVLGVPANFAASGTQASTLGGAVQMYTRTAPAGSTL